ncbi:MAG: hypothetical protein ACHRHE_03650 [Tepidisphaerales bacterium]
MIRWIAVLILMLAPVVTLAQTDASLLFNSWRGKSQVEAQGEFTLFGRATVDADRSSASLWEAQSHGRWRIDTSRDINPSLGYDWTHLEIGGNHRILPRQLDDASVAIASPLAQYDGWFAAGLLGLGYAGDNSFGNSRAWYGKADLFIGKQLKNGDALVFTLEYDGSRTFFPDVPLPGVAYSGHLGTQVDYVLGFPLDSLEWRISDQLIFSAAWFLTTDFDITLAYQVTPQWQIFGHYVSNELAFHVDQMPHDRRLLFFEQRVESGVKWSPCKGADLVGAVGYGFGRSFSQGFDDRNLNKITDLSDEPYLRAALELHF